MSTCSNVPAAAMLHQQQRRSLGVQAANSGIDCFAAVQSNYQTSVLCFASLTSIHMCWEYCRMAIWHSLRQYPPRFFHLGLNLLLAIPVYSRLDRCPTSGTYMNLMHGAHLPSLAHECKCRRERDLQLFTSVFKICTNCFMRSDSATHDDVGIHGEMICEVHMHWQNRQYGTLRRRG